MNVLGTYVLGNQQYFINIVRKKTTVTYTLFSRETKDDVYRGIMGEPKQDITITHYRAVEKYADSRYVVEILKKKIVSGDIYTISGRGCKILTKFIDTLNFATAYAFKPNSIIEDKSYEEHGATYKEFSADDRENYIAFTYTRKNREYTNVSYHDKSSRIEFEVSQYEYKGDEELIKYERLDSDQLTAATVQAVTYDMLADKLDMSWYERNGVKRKDYRSVGTIDEFETMIMTPLIEAVEQCESLGTQLLLSIDTETTGLNVYELSPDNKFKDHCVAIPIAWEDDKAFVIFTDMLHFQSVSNEYVMRRLAPLIERIGHNDDGERHVQLYRVESTKDKLETMHAFGLADEAKDHGAELNPGRVATINRKTINLVGHNAMFDGRVFYDNGVAPYFDDDTLQMAFVLNPKVVRGANKLKMLTRRLLNCETPELEDILGKGNEDKYKYLVDKHVAEIYGCADADFTRLIWKVLRGLMSDSMYETYRKQDMPMENILYISEYKGMNTYSDKLQELAENSKNDLHILTEFMYQYVGKIVYLLKQHHVLEQSFKAGIISESEYKEKVTALRPPEEDCRFEFELKAQSIRDVIYDILGYPVYAYTDGDVNGNNKKPKTDKFVMKKLISQKRDPEFRHVSSAFRLERDIISSSISYDDYLNLASTNSKKAANYVLVSAEEFNKLKYPLALVLQKYAELNKEYTSYFKPILEQNLEGKIFKNYSLARIETRRIMNPGQTMKGSLKELIRSYSDDYYLLDFDMAQVEYRIMASLSGLTEIIEKMRDPEKDYHIETASLVWDIPPYQVSKKLRKQTKSIGFGVPYGLSDRSLTERLFGVINDDTLCETALILDKWMKSNKPIVDFLEAKRDKALTEWIIPDKFRDYIDEWERDPIYDAKGKLISNEYKLDANGKKIPIKIGRVTNEYGFYRVFELNDLDNKKISSIRRMAGNYPIQSFAAELFRKILLRFYKKCEEYGIADKVVWHMLIHDELLCSVHKSVHPFLIYKIVKEACMGTMPGHTNYFVGINIGKTWADTKNDEREAPVYFVQRMIKRYDAGEFRETWIDDPGEFVMKYRRQYISDRIREVLLKIQPDLDTAPIKLAEILEKFTNYTVRSYVSGYPVNRKLPAENPNADWIGSFESWILERYGEGKEIIGEDGVKYAVKRGEVEIKQHVIDALDEPEENEADYWSFDGEGVDYDYVSDDAVTDESEDYYKNVQIADNKNARTIADLIVEKHKYQNLFLSKTQAIVNVDRKYQIAECKKYLESNVADSGLSVMFRTPIESVRWMRVKNTDWDKFDSFVTELKGGA